MKLDSEAAVGGLLVVEAGWVEQAEMGLAGLAVWTLLLVSWKLAALVVAGWP